ncbi:hypothetical protein LSM04_005575 [Trypanosoma melophagium]|nr:hypothetical protein LSM04_005575 [Trypanosoma melophagium]
MQFLSLDDEGRGRTPLFSPLVDSTASFITGGDTPRTSFKERDLSFQLLCEKNTFVERDGHVQVLTFHPTDRHFITGTDQGVIQVWSLPEENEYSASSTASTTDTSTSTALDYSHLLTNIQVSDVVVRPDSVVPPSCVLRYMYSTPALVQRGGNHSTTMGGDNIGHGSKTKDDPLTGLHLVDAAYRTLLCAVSRSGSVHLFSSYTNAATVRRVTSFWTMTREESLRSHQCLSSYHVPAMLLHLCGANGSITSWDLEYEHRVSTGVGSGELRGTPSTLTSHPHDAFTLAVGATSVYLYDLRNPCSATHVLRDPTVSGETLQQQRTIIGDYSNALCLHIGFSCRYPHGIVTGYGGEQGVVMLWDDRCVRHPLCQAIVSDAAANSSTSTFSSVRYMDIQHYSNPVTTMSVTADTLFITDALGQFSTTTTAATTTATSSLSSSAGTGTVSGSRTHIPLTQQPGAASFHPILPLCGVVSGNSLQLYGRKRKR